MPRRLVVLSFDRPDLKGLLDGLRTEGNTGRIWPEPELAALKGKHAEREAMKVQAEADGTDLPPEEEEEEEEKPVFPDDPEERVVLWEKCPDVLRTMEAYIEKPWKEPKVKVVEEGEEPKLPRLPPLPNEELLVVREEDDEAHLATTISGVEQMSKMLTEKFRIPVLNVHADGRSPEAICELLKETCASFPGPVVPLPEDIEGGDVKDYRELLRNGLGDVEVASGGPVSRQWSLWQQICPVSLFQKKLLPGKPEYAVDYAGSTFLLADKESKTEFSLWPKKYLVEPPSINAPGMALGWSILGPCGHGLAGIATQIQEAYGFDIIDLTKIITEAMSLQCEDEHDEDDKPPPDGPARLKIEEKADIRKGKPCSNETCVRLIAAALKIKPNIDLIAKQKAGLAAAQEALAKAAEDGKDPNELEGITLNDEGQPVVDYESPLLTPERCFLLVGFPERAEQAEALRDTLGLKLEKILTLKVADEAAEQDSAALLKAAGVGDLAPLQVALESYEGNTVGLTEALGDSGTVMDVIPQELDEDNRVVCVRKAIDPFYTVVATPENVEEIPDLDAEEEEVGEGETAEPKEKKTIPWGLTGLYCPVTLTEENWLFPGSKEFQATVGNSVYAVASEAASKKFTQEPTRYLPKTEVVIPPPRIMICGPTGAGVATQCELLRKKYRIHTLALEDEIVADVKRRVAELEAKRQVIRNDEKRSSPMIDADGRAIKQEEGSAEEDEPTFIDAEDMEEMNIAAMRTVMGPHVGACIVNGGFWADLDNPDLDDDAKTRKALHNLLIKARRAPDIVIIMDVNDDVASKRKLDLEEIDRQEEEAKIAKRKAKEEEREKFIMDGNDPADLPDDDAEEDEAGEKASEIADREFKERKEKQKTALSELFDALTTARVPVVKLQADRHINAVHKAITWHCRPFVEYRNSVIARHQAWKASPKRCQDLLVRGLARNSRYGEFSPIAPDIPLLSGRPDALTYGTAFRNRLFYPRSEAEAEQFLQRPLDFVDLPEPSRVAVHPAVAVIGAPLAGKTTLCTKLCEKLGAVSLSIASVVDFVLKQTLPCALSSQIATCLRSGSPVDAKEVRKLDELLVEALRFRLSFHDCVTKGWVLDDFPATVQQARLLTEKGVCPHSVFCVTLPEHLTFGRSAWLISKHPDHDSGELHQQQIQLQRLRLQAYTATSTQVRAYYGLSAGKVRILDGSKSLWAVYDRAVEEVKTTISQKLLYYRLTDRGLAAPVDGLGFTPERITNNESFFRRYCPVSLTLGNEIVPCNNPKYIVEYKSKLYWFASEENQKIFLDDPESYLGVQLPASTPKLLSFADRQSSLFCQIEDYCPVALVDKKELVKCNGGFIVQYSGKYWNLQNKEACAKFMRRPTRYTQRAKLPNKKPPQKQQGNNALLAALQKGQTLEIADMLSYLQVSVAEAISTSLVEGGHRRLLYPGKSGKESAMLFLANYLRAHNPLNTTLRRDECQATFDQFLDDCELPAELSEYVSRRHEAHAREAAKAEEQPDAGLPSEGSEELPGDSSKALPWTFEDERRYEKRCERFDELFKKKS
jgi:adenylate kinase family enzyme/YHS domain-containing protein